MFARIALSLVFAVGAVGAGAGTYAPPKGTVLYYPFDTPETALDSFGTAPGRLSAADGNVAFSAEGRFGGCLRFSGKDVLELRNLPDAMPLGTGAVTVVT